MHVKQQVKDFVHDVKRKLSSKHNRDSTCSTCSRDVYDGASSYSSSDTTDNSVWSSSASSLPNTPRRKRLVSFLHRSPSSSHREAGHGVARAGSKRYRLFSAPTVPSMHVDHLAQSGDAPETESIIDVCEQRIQSVAESITPSQEDYTDVMDISVRSVTTDSTPEPSIFRDSASQSQPSSCSDTTATLVSSDYKKSVSDSDSPLHSIHLQSDENSASLISSITSALDLDPPMSDQVPAAADDDEITLVHSSSPAPVPPSPPPPVPQAPRTNVPAQPPRSTAASPAPIYIPRLTAPSMFLPIPNTYFVSASISHIHVSSPLKHPPSTPFEASINDQPVLPSPHVSTDPLSALLTKYVPAEQRPRRDVVGEYAGRDIHEMVMSNSWRALARMARDRIVASDPEDLARILDLWSLRLSSLARLRLTNQASAECTNLFAVLNAVHPKSAPGSFPGSGVLTPSIHPSSPAPASSLTLSPSAPSGLVQLPGTPSQKPSALPGGSAAVRSTHDLVHPFELTVFHARVHYWSGDALGYVDTLSRILGQCKDKAREEARVVTQRRKAKTRDEGTPRSEATGGDESTDAEADKDDVLAAAEANLSMWLERIARVCLILASQMIEMNDYQAAINLLAPLCTHRIAPAFQPTPSPELHSALARVYLLSGNLVQAEEHFAIAAAATGRSDVIATNTALLAAASGDWTRAEQALSDTVAKHPGDFTATNNLAVTLLCQGRIKEGIDLLEGALNTSPSSVVVAEPFLFNLSTLYELRSAAAIDKKRELLIKVAQWSGDGLKTSCLKMPSS